ncbi:hypothetical protein CH63R_14545 [Colletotrichum higginsianum IMI 349063]|uniref:Uncharacterized protein n=1 Tax=Colletotrichum higginsianum (strain IMI 349063) TaxID=759273 RepID=A0A1B7XQE2_COLHI|nr:hypothetical protein CH63R_14545 [Colletotrichum higginsianum IMI 349063]OBR01973.1 hypothetical protein CH63R_14545 [Colletotrichum higginsianum IMI 349063]
MWQQRKAQGSQARRGGEAVFSATIDFNPTYGQLDGAVVPEGQSIPDINQLGKTSTQIPNQPDSTGHQYDSHQLEGEAETAAGDVPESAGQNFQNMTKCVEDNADADADADAFSSPEAVAVTLEALGREKVWKNGQTVGQIGNFRLQTGSH